MVSHETHPDAYPTPRIATSRIATSPVTTGSVLTETAMAGAALTRAATAGDTADEWTFEDLFRQYAPYVARIGHRLLGRDDEVDDLVQDVFLAAHRGLRKLRQQEAVKGWLATVAVRQARKRLRMRRVRTALYFDASSTPSDYDNIADSGATPEDRTLLAQIYRQLDRIPVQQRLAWTLRHIEGETLERVAQLCRCSLATAKRRIKAAELTLSRELDLSTRFDTARENNHG